MAETFFDKDRRPWDIQITIGTARDVFKKLGIDLQNPLHLSRLMGDAEGLYLTGELVALLCGPMVRATWPDCRTPEEVQAKVDTTMEDHAVWRDAYGALCRAVADFCRRHGRPAVAGHVAGLPECWAAMEAATAEPPPTPPTPTPGNGSGAEPVKLESPTPSV